MDPANYSRRSKNCRSRHLPAVLSSRKRPSQFLGSRTVSTELRFVTNREASAKWLPVTGLVRIIAVNGIWLTKKSDSYFEQAWHTRKGAGVLLINLVHDLDLLWQLRYLAGQLFWRMRVFKRSACVSDLLKWGNVQWSGLNQAGVLMGRTEPGCRAHVFIYDGAHQLLTATNASCVMSSSSVVWADGRVPQDRRILRDPFG